MPGHRPWREIRDASERDPERRRRREAARHEAEDEQVMYRQSLAELRRERAFTQAQLAEALDVPQSQVSRLERQSELYISTLARYIEAMGGYLELIGVFGDQRIVLALGEPETPTNAAHTATVNDIPAVTS